MADLRLLDPAFSPTDTPLPRLASHRGTTCDRCPAADDMARHRRRLLDRLGRARKRRDRSPEAVRTPRGIGCVPQDSSTPRPADHTALLRRQ